MDLRDKINTTFQDFFDSLPKKNHFDTIADKLFCTLIDKLEEISETENLTEKEEEIIFKKLKELL